MPSDQEGTRTDMARSPKPLFDLLRALFRSNDDLYGLLANYDYSRREDLLDALPATSVPRATFIMRTIEQIQANGLDTTAFFAVLTERFPGQKQLVEAAARAYLTQGTDTLDEADTTSDGGGDTPPAETLTTFEKIMGDRPTFLDVSYLAIGYQRSKSVAKLRMKFPKGWYAGTAFLVAPNTLLTAHHNLWTDGKPADAVEVIFDYERSSDGPDMEGLVVKADPASFVGASENDWGLLRLSEPQLDRPLATLSKKPAVEGDRVAIIQHPSGMLKQVALHHNLVTYVDTSRVQYLTDTLAGSSGSPVFDSDWNVVAVHHAGGELPLPSDKKKVIYRNQGIPIQCVLDGIRELKLTL